MKNSVKNRVSIALVVLTAAVVASVVPYTVAKAMVNPAKLSPTRAAALLPTVTPLPAASDPYATSTYTATTTEEDFTYDADSHVTNVSTNGALTETFTYDAEGNITSTNAQ